MATLAPRKYPPFDRLSLFLSLLSRRTGRLSPSFHLHPLPLPSNGVHRSLSQPLAVIARNHTRGYYENDSGRCAFLFFPLFFPPPFFRLVLLVHPFFSFHSVTTPFRIWKCSRREIEKRYVFIWSRWKIRQIVSTFFRGYLKRGG